MSMYPYWLKNQNAANEYAAYMAAQEQQKIVARRANDFLSDHLNGHALNGFFSVAYDPESGLLLASYINERFFIFDTFNAFRLVLTTKNINEAVLEYYRKANEKAP